MKPVKQLLSIAACALVYLGPVHAATLTSGDQVTLQYTHGGTSIYQDTSTVGSGHEFSLYNALPIDLNAGIDGDGFSLSSNGNYCGIRCDGQEAKLTFSGLDFGTDFTIENFVNNSGYAMTTTVHDSSSFSLSWTEATDYRAYMPQGVLFSASFGTAVTPAAVPLPAGAPLLIAALGMLAWRRKKPATAGAMPIPA
jgi:hypothetical protein